MQPVGYCLIKKEAKTGKGMNIQSFLGQRVRVMEFSKHDGSVLVLNSEANAMCMFDKEDVLEKFECTFFGEYILPANLNFTEQIIYVTKLTTRKGGWHLILKQMIILNSLRKGKYNDDFIFQKEREENLKN